MLVNNEIVIFKQIFKAKIVMNKFTKSLTALKLKDFITILGSVNL